MSDDSRPDPYSFPGAPGQRGLEVTRDEWRGEIDDGAFERAYQRMVFRRNQEALRREIQGHSYAIRVTVDDDEPCLCGTDFTCLAPEHDPARLAELVPNPFAEEGS